MKSYDDNLEPGINTELQEHKEMAERMLAAGKLRQDLNNRTSTSRILAVVIFFVMALYFLTLFL